MADKIRVSYSRTVNLGNYESARIDAEIEEEITEGDETSYQTLFDELFKECEDFVLKRCEIEVGIQNAKEKIHGKSEDDIPY